MKYPNAIPKCKYCGGNCHEESPKEILFSFGKIEIRIWNWYKMNYSNVCYECKLDEEGRDRKNIIDSSFQNGYMKGYEERDRI
jgi:hypothetical protein